MVSLNLTMGYFIIGSNPIFSVLSLDIINSNFLDCSDVCSTSPLAICWIFDPSKRRRISAGIGSCPIAHRIPQVSNTCCIYYGIALDVIMKI